MHNPFAVSPITDVPTTEGDAVVLDDTLSAEQQERFNVEAKRLQPIEPQTYVTPDGDEITPDAQWSRYPDGMRGIEPITSLEFPHWDVGNYVWSDRFGQGGKGYPLLPTYKNRVGTPTRRVDILFVMPCVLLEDLDRRYSPPAMLKKGAANLFTRNLGRSGLADCHWDYTTLVRYNCKGLKLTSKDINWAKPLLFAEIKRLRPRIIVAMGKAVFDSLFTTHKIAIKDVMGGIFDITAPEIRDDPAMKDLQPILMLMDPITLSFSKPEFIERALVDLRNIKYELEKLKTPEAERVLDIRTNYQILKTPEHVGNWIGDMTTKQVRRMAVDAEWKGKTYVDGELRAFQTCWADGQVAYIRLRDEDGRTMNITDQEVGNIMRPVFEHKDFQYIGHNFPADAVWIESKFKLDTYQRLYIDTMYMQQLINEYADLKLERLAVRYTRLGRYDIPLLLWKKENAFDEDDGYGAIPDKLLIPYGCADVDTTFRVAPILLNQLIAEGPKLLCYWRDISRAFTSDCFISKMMVGLPIDIAYADKLRVVYHENLKYLKADFLEQLKIEARKMLLEALTRAAPVTGPTALTILETQRAVNVDPNEMVAVIQAMTGNAWVEDARLRPTFEHWLAVDEFNYNSPDHLRRWMFDVKGLMPIKTTKKDGITMAWEKVLKLSPETRRSFTPACDKQTIKIYEGTDALVAHVGQLKSVSTMCKTFLRDADKDSKERGIHGWICSDGRIHANFASTETGRPRAWQPNILNWPKSVSKPIEKAFKRINLVRADKERDRLMDLAAQMGANPDMAAIEEAVKEIQFAPVSLRSIAKAPRGQCFTDADLVTAEVVGLGYLCGDKNLIAACEARDEQYGVVTKTDEEGNSFKKPVRISYIDTITSIPREAQDPTILIPKDHPDLLRGEDGLILHPKRDVHWQMAERFMKLPREKLDKELHRGGGKVGMFSIPYGAEGPLIDRNIEVLTGIKPAKDTGIAIKQAYESMFVVATAFLNEMGLLPNGKDNKEGTPPGCYDSVSGRRRHFKYTEIADVEGISSWAKNSLLSSMGREARNYPLQEIVAATMARAHANLLHFYRTNGMKSRPMILLYDALTVLGPLEERFIVRDSLQREMSDNNVWHIKRSKMDLQFDIEVDFTIRWAVDPSKAARKILYDKSILHYDQEFE